MSLSLVIQGVSGNNLLKMLGFIEFLYNLVYELSENHREICEWSIDGCSFTIYNRDDFMKKMIQKEQFSKFFRTVRYDSLVRRLTYYQIYKRRNDKGELGDNFWNDYFIRDKPELLSFICSAKKNSPERKLMAFESTIFNNTTDNYQVYDKSFNILNPFSPNEKLDPTFWYNNLERSKQMSDFNDDLVF